MAVSQNKHGHFTHEQISKDFLYEPETGRLFRLSEIKATRYNSNLEKDVPGQVKYSGYNIMVTHIIFMLMTGRWSEIGLLVDHKDTDVSNNKWLNLREATESQNNCNRPTQGRWLTTDNIERGVVIKPNGYRVILAGTDFGWFASLEEANVFARSKWDEVYGEFKHHSLMEQDNATN